MNLHLDYTDKQIVKKNVKISGSKSESNRLLILSKLYKNLSVKNLSNSDDTRTMQQILREDSNLADVHHAGTAMRFLTAYFATRKDKEVVLTGSERMQQRPIKILVDALIDLGSEITYLNNEGYPPIKIKGSILKKDKVSINGNVSSQYISALLLIAPSLENGLVIELIGEVTSRPYLEMTLALLRQLEIRYEWIDTTITIFPKKEIEEKIIVVESDWSSASYYYSLIALSEVGAEVTLSAYKKGSLQGDSCLVDIYKNFGVKTVFQSDSITLKKEKIASQSASIKLDLINAPDIAQTIAVTCFGLGICCDLTGLHTLKIKETDRLVALQVELQKLGAEIDITDKSLHLKQHKIINKNVTIQTYNDHRMAMAFAPLALKAPIFIADAEVVTKSYVDFWKDFKSLFIS